MTPDGHCKLLDFGALAAFGPSRARRRHAAGHSARSAAGRAARSARRPVFARRARVLDADRSPRVSRASASKSCSSALDEPPPAAIERSSDGIPDGARRAVLSLLSGDPLARPASAAEVIARAQRRSASSSRRTRRDSERLAQSFLLSPRFTGRAPQLARARCEDVEAAAPRTRRGGAHRGGAGHGPHALARGESACARSSRARPCSAWTRACTASCTAPRARSLLRLLDAVPKLARESAALRPALAALGAESKLASPLERRSRAAPSRSDRATPRREVDGAGGTLDGLVRPMSAAASRWCSQVDNVEDADDASLGLLAALAKRASRDSVAPVDRDRARAPGPRERARIWRALRGALRARHRCAGIAGRDRWSSCARSSATRPNSSASPSGSTAHRGQPAALHRDLPPARRRARRSATSTASGRFPRSPGRRAARRARRRAARPASPRWRAGAGLAECLSLQREQPTPSCAGCSSTSRDEAGAR